MKFKSQVYTQVSGSVGGLTYSHNKGGLYTRSRAIPVNPGTDFQQTIRAAVAGLTTRWGQTLTPAQRAAWANYAAAVPLPDAFGDLRQVPPLSHYIRCNVPRIQASIAVVDVAPVNFNLGTYTNPTISLVDASDDTLSLAFTNTDAWAIAAGGFMLLLCSRAQSPSVQFFKGPYRFAGKVTGAVVPPTSPQVFPLPFPVELAQIIHAQIRVIQVDGRLSSPFRLSLAATA